MPEPKSLTDLEIGEITILRECGKSLGNIAEQIKRSGTVIRNYLLNQTGDRVDQI